MKYYIFISINFREAQVPTWQVLPVRLHYRLAFCSNPCEAAEVVYGNEVLSINYSHQIMLLAAALKCHPFCGTCNIIIKLTLC